MTTATASKATAADVRTWARSQGIVVGNRGRLSAEVVSAYNNSSVGRANPYEAPTA